MNTTGRFEEVTEAGLSFFEKGTWSNKKPQLQTEQDVLASNIEYVKDCGGELEEWHKEYILEREKYPEFMLLKHADYITQPISWFKDDDYELLLVIIEAAAIIIAVKKYNLNLSEEFEEQWRQKVATASADYFSGEGWFYFKKTIQDYKTNLFPLELQDFIKRVKEAKREKIKKNSKRVNRSL